MLREAIFVALVSLPVIGRADVSGLPVKYQETVAYAEVFGLELSRQDWAVEVATDRAKALGADLAQSDLGWIAERFEDSWKVSYLSKKGGQPSILFSIDVTSKGPQDSSYPGDLVGKELTARQLALLNARLTATTYVSNSEILRCTKNFNWVVIPFTDDEKEYFWVYLTAASDQAGVQVLGGHHKFKVSGDGLGVLEYHPHTKACMTVEAKNDSKAIMVTHLTSAAPNEFHVYMSYLYRMPVYVKGPDNAIWAVEGHKLRIVKVASDEAAEE